jgi:CRP-like cAMP-binding protein
MMFTRQIVIPVLAKYPEARMLLLQHARKRLMALNIAIGADPGHAGGTQQGCAIGFGSALNQADAKLFAASSVFRQARADFLRELSSSMTSKTADEGKKIIEEGDPFVADQDFVYWICRGQAEVWKQDNFITVLAEGDIFGEMPLFPNGVTLVEGLRREATVKSKTKMVLKMVRACVLKELLHVFSDPELNDALEKGVEFKRQKMQKACGLSSEQKPLSLDFMFMKVPHTLKDGTRVPMHENIGTALLKSGLDLAPPATLALDQQMAKLRLK